MLCIIRSMKPTQHLSQSSIWCSGNAIKQIIRIFHLNHIMNRVSLSVEQRPSDKSSPKHALKCLVPSNKGEKTKGETISRIDSFKQKKQTKGYSPLAKHFFNQCFQKFQTPKAQENQRATGIHCLRFKKSSGESASMIHDQPKKSHAGKYQASTKVLGSDFSGIPKLQAKQEDSKRLDFSIHKAEEEQASKKYNDCVWGSQKINLSPNTQQIRDSERLSCQRQNTANKQSSRKSSHDWHSHQGQSTLCSTRAPYHQSADRKKSTESYLEMLSALSGSNSILGRHLFDSENLQQSMTAPRKDSYEKTIDNKTTKINSLKSSETDSQSAKRVITLHNRRVEFENPSSTDNFDSKLCESIDVNKIKSQIPVSKTGVNNFGLQGSKRSKVASPVSFKDLIDADQQGFEFDAMKDSLIDKLDISKTSQESLQKHFENPRQVKNSKLTKLARTPFLRPSSMDRVSNRLFELTSSADENKSLTSCFVGGPKTVIQQMETDNEEQDMCSKETIDLPRRKVKFLNDYAHTIVSRYNKSSEKKSVLQESNIVFQASKMVDLEGEDSQSRDKYSRISENPQVPSLGERSLAGNKKFYQSFVQQYSQKNHENQDPAIIAQSTDSKLVQLKKKCQFLRSTPSGLENLEKSCESKWQKESGIRFDLDTFIEYGPLN